MGLFIFASFLSAFLLFSMEMIFGKAILPGFGGGSSIWTTCTFFYQFMLLLGYIFAHWSLNRIGMKKFISIYIALFLASLFLFPISLYTGWMQFVGSQYPVLNLLSVLLFSIGIPFFLISSISPILQKWYLVETSE